MSLLQKAFLVVALINIGFVVVTVMRGNRRMRDRDREREAYEAVIEEGNMRFDKKGL